MPTAFPPRDAARKQHPARATLLAAALLVAGCVGENIIPPLSSPGAPTIGSATPGNTTAIVFFTPPTSNGGSSISQYTATCTPASGSAGSGSAGSSPVTVTGLTNAVTYSCSVTATNSNGTSVASGSVSVTPAGPPDAPTIGAATGGDASASVAFTAPANNNGAAITSYTATCTSSGQTTRTASAPVSPIPVTQLTNGSTYLCSVKATNSAGQSVSSADASVTPAGVPSAPIIGAATAGLGSVSVAFTAPTANGGSTITGYTASCAGGGSTFTGTGTSSPINVTGLTNGTQYGCTVKATNAVGNSAASGSVTVTPGFAPGAPTIGAATPSSGSASIAFSPPASNGGVTISSYTATCTATGQTTRTKSGTASPIVVDTLTNGVTYLCNVKATNSIGTGAASADVSALPVGPPPAPTIGAATPGNTTASIAFTAPTSNGGAAITGYTVTCIPTATGTGSASPIAVTGLANGTAYSCSVKATNSFGTGTASGNVSVTPRTTPGAPTIGTATSGNGSASIAFTAPASNGGATITTYTVTCTPSGTQAGSTSPITVSGLTNGTTYTCSVKATNAAGTGGASGTVGVTPAGPANTSSLLCPYSHSIVTSIVTSPPTTLTSSVSYTCTSTVRTGTSNQIPEYTTGPFPIAGNPNAISAQAAPPFKTSLAPLAAVSTTNVAQGVIGYAKNGVKFDPGTAEVCPGASYCPGGITGTWNVEALGQTLFSTGVDGSNAHVQPNGAYHYHGMPTDYMNYLGGNDGSTMIFVGFALDGFPIYAKWGYNLPLDATSGIREIVSSYRKKLIVPSGRIDTLTVAYGTFTQDWEYVAGLGDLDECNGRFAKTPEFPSGIYQYYITNGFPYIQRCYKGSATP